MSGLRSPARQVWYTIRAMYVPLLFNKTRVDSWWLTVPQLAHPQQSNTHFNLKELTYC